MAKDKYKALWLSHSSTSDFLRCPRLYYLKNVYKDPKTGRKIALVNPSLSLGQAIHDVIDNLSTLPSKDRLKISLQKRLDVSWNKISGKKGGFKSEKEEKEYKERAAKMLKRLEENPGPIGRKAIKLKAIDNLPYYWFSEDENIILCGKIDWIEYLEKNNTIHLIDFKTGKNEEDESSLQLPIYNLLVSNLQKRKIEKASYWYLDRESFPQEVFMPDINTSFEKIYDIAKRIKLGRQINYFKCPTNGCFACKGLERIIKGEGQKVGISEYNQDIFILND